jgi:hypothetical protein
MSNAARELTTMVEGNSVTIQERAPSEGAAMLSMIERASRDPNVDVEKFERLMLMKERVEKEAARKAFNAAIAIAKGEIPPIVKNAVGHNDKRYADFSAIATAVDPILARHGLSYRFRTAQPDKTTVTVTCVIAHVDGYSEENTLTGGPDTSGSKNAIQAIGSSLTYLQRYSLVGALGLPMSKDDDGQSVSTGGSVSEDQLLKLRDMIESVDADEVKFARHMKVERLSELPASTFQAAMKALTDFGRQNGKIK